MRSRFASSRIAPLLVLYACAGHGMNTRTPPGSTYLSVQVRNESSEIVQVYYVADAGWRVRVATVGPLQTGLFSATLANAQPGRFATRRLSGEPGFVLLQGHADPHAIRSALVLLTIGPSPEFDRWTLRG